MSNNGLTMLDPIRRNYLWGTEDWMLSDLHIGFEGVPILVKVVKSKDTLEIQGHPKDDFSAQMEHANGNTEMWYITDCEPGAYLYYGLKRHISEEEFRRRLRDDTILKVCRKVPAKKGDVFYIPAGMIHAIGKGMTVVQIQQSSELDPRDYNYERMDHNNKKRASEGNPPMGNRIQKEGYFKTLLVQCPYFTVYRYEVEDGMEGMTEKSFQSLLILKGEGELQTDTENRKLNAGESIFLPQKTGSYKIRGNLQFLMSEL